MATKLACDNCANDLGEEGYEITRTVYVLDRSDRDADARTELVHACSPPCLAALAPGEVVERFSPAGKKKRA